MSRRFFLSTLRSLNKNKTIRGELNNVSIEHDKIGRIRIMQDGGSALDGDNKRVF